jgi:peptide/nickel transport system substrate-binding protein
MRLTAWLPLAALSPLVAIAATHPQYGGTLRVEMRAAPAALDAAESEPWQSLIHEPLVRLDAAGIPQPWLARAWQPEGNGKRWKFALRPGVKMQDGNPLTPAVVAALLPGATADSDAVVLRAEHGLSSLLLELAGSRIAPTGPFRLTAFDAGHRATFVANEDYWGGRPFVDSIEVQFGRPLRDQFTDLELGKTDIAELSPADVRRATEHGRTVWASANIRLIALAVEPGRMADPRLREALARSIDRPPMYNVLLQKQGEISAALLPQWISGYAFIFPTAPDVARARVLVSALPLAGRAIVLSFDPGMPAARQIAERVAVNARDAGLTVQVAPQGQPADVRLVETRIHNPDPARALARLASGFGLETPAVAATLEATYEFERKLLEDYRVIPLFHVPDRYAAAGRVRVYEPPPITPFGGWRFDNLWLAGTAP